MPITEAAVGIGRFAVVSTMRAQQSFAHQRHGFAYAAPFVGGLHIRRHLRSEQPRVGGFEIWRQTLESLAPTFVKFGELLNQPPDLVPTAYYEQFRRSQQHVTTVLFVEVWQSLALQIGADSDMGPAGFAALPLAAASVDPAHGAQKRFNGNDGRFDLGSGGHGGQAPCRAGGLDNQPLAMAATYAQALLHTTLDATPIR